MFSDFAIYLRYLYLYILLISLPIFCIEIMQYKYFEDNITINTLMFIIAMPYVIWAYKFILNMLLFKEYKKIVVTTHKVSNINWKIAIIYWLIQSIAQLLCVIVCNLFFDSNNELKHIIYKSYAHNYFLCIFTTIS